MAKILCLDDTHNKNSGAEAHLTQAWKTRWEKGVMEHGLIVSKSIPFQGMCTSHPRLGSGAGHNNKDLSKRTKTECPRPNL